MAIKEFQGEYRFLSNFWESPIPVSGVGTFASAEHLYQAFKTTLPSEMVQVMTAPTPGAAKRVGKLITLRSDWDEVKDRAMEITVFRKFYSNPELMQKLWDTVGSTLIEGNHWHDNYWGSCSCPQCEDKPKLNQLGLILMDLRDETYCRAAIDI